jgi:hypothetical protein
MFKIDIIIILILLLMLTVIKIINNKFIENYTDLATNTLNRATNIKDTSQINSSTINSLISQANDITDLQESKKGLEDSKTKYTVDGIGQRELEEQDKLFNSAHGKFIKHRNRQCDYLDINPPIPCEDVQGDTHNKITDCQMNCANNCLNDPNCISFEYNNSTKSCRLSSSCYPGNISNNNSRDLYFKRGSAVPPIAQFKKNPKKNCSTATKISGATYTDQTISQCAQKCIDNPECISFEHKKQDGINKNVCNLTNDCHLYNFNNDDNTDVYSKNNVFINEIVNTENAECPNDNKTRIPFKKKIIFFKYPDYKKKQWSWEFNSNENKNVPNVPRNKGHDDFDSAKVPPRTVLHLYDGKNYKKYINHYWVNYDGLGISSIRNPKNKKKHNKVASFKIRNR